MDGFRKQLITTAFSLIAALASASAFGAPPLPTLPFELGGRPVESIFTANTAQSAIWSEYENVIDSGPFTIQKNSIHGQVAIPGFLGSLFWKRATPRLRIGSPSGNVSWNGAESVVGAHFIHHGIVGPFENATFEYSHGSSENTLMYSGPDATSQFASLVREQALKAAWTSRVVPGVAIHSSLLYGWNSPAEIKTYLPNRSIENGSVSRVDWSVTDEERLPQMTLSGSFADNQQSTSIMGNDLELATSDWRNTQQDYAVKIGTPTDDSLLHVNFAAGSHIWETSYKGRTFDPLGNPLTRVPFGEGILRATVQDVGMHVIRNLKDFRFDVSSQVGAYQFDGELTAGHLSMFGIVPVFDAVSALPLESMAGLRFGGLFDYHLGDGAVLEYRGSQFIPVHVSYRTSPSASNNIPRESPTGAGNVSGGLSHRFGIRFGW